MRRWPGVRVSSDDPDGTAPVGDAGMRARIIATIIALSGVALMLASCSQPKLSCSGNGGATHDSAAVCAGVIPLAW